MSPSEGVERSSRLAHPRPHDDEQIRKENGYEKVIGIARKEIGVVERTGNNDGKRIAEYLDYVGFKEGAPYCAAFVSWCFAKAGYPVPKTAWSPALFPAVRLVKAPKPGVVYGIYFANLNRIGHCGLVESIRNSWLTGIEGNTNLAGSREGDGVHRRIRHARTIYRYADWLKQVSVKCLSL